MNTIYMNWQKFLFELNLLCCPALSPQMLGTKLSAPETLKTSVAQSPLAFGCPMLNDIKSKLQNKIKPQKMKYLIHLNVSEKNLPNLGDVLGLFQKRLVQFDGEGTGRR